jgi:hypothetical protein
MDGQEQFLTEALQRAAAIIKDVDEKYHEVAFPIILQAIIDGRSAPIPKISSRQSNTQQDTQDLRLPPTMSVNEFSAKLPKLTFSSFCMLCLLSTSYGKRETVYSSRFSRVLRKVA